MLNVSELAASYGLHEALSSVSLHVESNEIVVILGANGAGKSTLLKAIAGICEGHSIGEVTLDGRVLSGLNPEQIVESGIAFVPEGRGIFGDLSVHENLLLGAYAEHARDRQIENLQRVLELFPKLAERKKQIARTMSGGEQQMVAIGRALMSAPSILMLDEPSLGLSPLLCKELFSSLTQVRETGVGILLVEQNARQSLGIADRGYLLENGKIVGENKASELLHDPAVQAAYLGGAAAQSTRRQPVQAQPAARVIDAQPAVSQKVLQALPPTVPQTAASQPSHTSVDQSPASFTPHVGTAQTVAAGALIGDDIEAMVARAATTATQRSPVSVADTAANLLPQAQGQTQTQTQTQVDSASVYSAQSGTQDAAVQKLLADFEAAALAASNRSTQSQSHRSPVGDRDTHGRDTYRRDTNSRDEDDPRNLPHIPIYRKSTVTVYRRDMSGKLQKQERS